MKPSKPFVIFFLTLVLFVGPAFSTSQDQLIFAIDLIRHGDRNPLVDFPAAPHVWPEGLGQLTPLGMRQEYELGKKMRQRYIAHEKLLPKSYKRETLYVQSTDTDRTLMSATCFLMGLYPPGTGPSIASSFEPALPGRFQPIPVHKMKFSMFNEQSFKQLIMEKISSMPSLKKKEAELQPYLPSWRKATGLPLTSPQEVGLLADTVFIEQLKHVPLPKGLTPQDLSMLFSFDGDVLLYQDPEVGKAAEGRLLQDMAFYLRQAAAQKTKLKYLLYSAHDSTILAVLSALGAPLKKRPHYASDVNFSLFSKKNRECYLLITMNGESVKLPCSQDRSVTLTQFLKLAKGKSF